MWLQYLLTYVRYHDKTWIYLSIIIILLTDYNTLTLKYILQIKEGIIPQFLAHKFLGEIKNSSS